jgi:DNA-binding NarL/FixJ family response regulator
MTIMSVVSPISVLVDHPDPLLAAGVATTLQAVGGFQILPRDGSSMPLLPHGIRALHSSCVLVSDYATGLRHAAHAGRRGTILILTQFDDEGHIRHALQQGIRGYLLQGCSIAALIEGVLALHRGTTAFAPAVAARIAESSSHRSLTERELTVLHHVMLGFSNKKISYQLGISTGTVNAHIRKIFEKLDASARTEAVAIARRRGLLVDERPAPSSADLLKRVDYEVDEQPHSWRKVCARSVGDI